MDYLPYLQPEVIDCASQFFGQTNSLQGETQKAYIFVESFWRYLNPLNQEKIESASFLEIMSLLMNNLTANESSLAMVIAGSLL